MKKENRNEDKNEEGQKKGGIPDEMWGLWKSRCDRFRNVEWVRQWKPGVKVLRINI